MLGDSQLQPGRQGTTVGTVWKVKLGSKSYQFETGRKKAHNCKIVTRGYSIWELIQEKETEMYGETDI